MVAGPNNDFSYKKKKGNNKKMFWIEKKGHELLISQNNNRVLFAVINEECDLKLRNFLCFLLSHFPLLLLFPPQEIVKWPIYIKSKQKKSYSNGKREKACLRGWMNGGWVAWKMNVDKPYGTGCVWLLSCFKFTRNKEGQCDLFKGKVDSVLKVYKQMLTLLCRCKGRWEEEMDVFTLFFTCTKQTWYVCGPSYKCNGMNKHTQFKRSLFYFLCSFPLRQKWIPFHKLAFPGKCSILFYFFFRLHASVTGFIDVFCL